MAGNPCCSENHVGDGKRSKPKDGESIVEIDVKFGDGELIEPKQRKREFEIYIAAMLPQLRYYEYRLVNEEDRAEGHQKYRHKLLSLSNEEEKEEIALQKAKEEEELIHKEKAAWVENLRGSELFQVMFSSDPYGDALVKLDETMQEIYEEFKTEFTKTTRDLYEIGLAKKLERDEEENQFLSCLKAAKEETRKEGEGIMTELFKEKDHTFSEICRLAQRLEDEGGVIQSASKNTEDVNGDAGDALVEVSTLGEEDFTEQELVVRMHSLGEEFKNRCNKVWSQLMALETHLYEQIEDTISTFERNLSELVSSLIEAVQVHFVSCREFATQFHEKITTYAPRYFAATKARIAACQENLYMTDEDDESDQNSTSIQGQETKDDCPSVPKILEQCLDDKEALQNMLISSHDSHIQVIDTKEDAIMSYSKEWLRKKIDKYTREEIEGNRKRLHEIITVTNLLKEELEELQQACITLPMLAEMELMDG
ncbi:dynein regulatory complex subunit 3-like isoform X2 [Ischnura elegans]|nr:dynein regulatory complex subunit 3-like isoform X2 [Ischnura elegans]